MSLIRSTMRCAAAVTVVWCATAVGLILVPPTPAETGEGFACCNNSRPQSHAFTMHLRRHGMCNRLRSMASAALFAADLGMPLQLDWEPEYSCNATFSDLFEAAEGIVAVGSGAARGAQVSSAANSALSHNAFAPARQTVRSTRMGRALASTASADVPHAQRCGEQGGGGVGGGEAGASSIGGGQCGAEQRRGLLEGGVTHVFLHSSNAFLRGVRVTQLLAASSAAVRSAIWGGGGCDVAGGASCDGGGSTVAVNGSAHAAQLQQMHASGSSSSDSEPDARTRATPVATAASAAAVDPAANWPPYGPQTAFASLPSYLAGFGVDAASATSAAFTAGTAAAAGAASPAAQLRQDVGGAGTAAAEEPHPLGRITGHPPAATQAPADAEAAQRRHRLAPPPSQTPPPRLHVHLTSDTPNVPPYLPCDAFFRRKGAFYRGLRPVPAVLSAVCEVWGVVAAGEGVVAGPGGVNAAAGVGSAQQHLPSCAPYRLARDGDVGTGAEAAGGGEEEGSQSQSQRPRPPHPLAFKLPRGRPVIGLHVRVHDPLHDYPVVPGAGGKHTFGDPGASSLQGFVAAAARMQVARSDAVVLVATNDCSGAVLRALRGALRPGSVYSSAEVLRARLSTAAAARAEAETGDSAATGGDGGGSDGAAADGAAEASERQRSEQARFKHRLLRAQVACLTDAHCAANRDPPPPQARTPSGADAAANPLSSDTRTSTSTSSGASERGSSSRGRGACDTQAALADLLLLSQADVIVGSYYSSFTEEAAAFHGAPLITLANGAHMTMLPDAAGGGWNASTLQARAAAAAASSAAAAAKAEGAGGGRAPGAAALASTQGGASATAGATGVPPPQHLYTCGYAPYVNRWAVERQMDRLEQSAAAARGQAQHSGPSHNGSPDTSPAAEAAAGATAHRFVSQPTRSLLQAEGLDAASRVTFETLPCDTPRAAALRDAWGLHGAPLYCPAE